jgi:hypothetical protein
VDGFRASLVIFVQENYNNVRVKEGFNLIENRNIDVLCIV